MITLPSGIAVDRSTSPEGRLVYIGACGPPRKSTCIPTLVVPPASRRRLWSGDLSSPFPMLYFDVMLRMPQRASCYPRVSSLGNIWAQVIGCLMLRGYLESSSSQCGIARFLGAICWAANC